MLDSNELTIDIFSGLTGDPLLADLQNDLLSGVPGNGGLLETELPTGSIEAVSSINSEAIVIQENLLETPPSDIPIGSEVVGEFDALTGERSANASSTFSSGVFTVGQTGEVTIDFLFDGGQHKGELAIFSLSGMEGFEPGSKAFIKEAARRALSNSELGYVVIRDKLEGAKFDGKLGEKDHNKGDYLGAKTLTMTPGDSVGVMLVSNGTVQKAFNKPKTGKKAPLFSLATAEPSDGLNVGQMADVTGDGSIFAFEDLHLENRKSDADYNDLIFKMQGATGTVALLDDAIDPDKEWRHTALGQELLEEANPPVSVIDATLIADNTGEFDDIYSANPAINDNGTVAFYAQIDNQPLSTIGIFSGNGETTIPRATYIYDFSNFQPLAPAVIPGENFDINNINQIAYRGEIFTGTSFTFEMFGPNGPIDLPGGTPYSQKDNPDINNRGTVAFRRGFPGSIYGYGIWRDQERIAVTNTGSTLNWFSSFKSLSHPTINNLGTIAFTAGRTNPLQVFPGFTYSWPDGVDEGIFIHNGGGFAAIADNSGVISDFGETGSAGGSIPPTFFYPIPPDINNNNTVAFFANLNTGESGIFTSNGSSLTPIADDSGAFSSFSKVAINDNNTVAFLAGLDAGGGGIFTGPDPVADKAVAVGDSLFGSTITSLSFSHKGLNNADQIGFYATLANGTEGIFRLDLDLS